MCKGYLQATIMAGGEQKTCKIHRVVALAFLAKPNGKDQINHKDGNKTNNAVSNLEWVTASENALHAVRTGLSTPPNITRLPGWKTFNAKLTETDVAHVLDLRFVERLSITKISERTGVSIAQVGRICRGETWIDVFASYKSKQFVRSNNNTGWLGVLPVKGIKSARGRRWRAQISHKGKNIHIGSFHTPEEAAAAYDQAAREYHGPNAITNAAIRGGACSGG